MRQANGYKENGMRSLIGHTDKKSTAYTWAAKYRKGGATNVTVTRGDDGFYTVERDAFEAPAEIGEAVETHDREHSPDCGCLDALELLEWMEWQAGAAERKAMSEARDAMQRTESEIKNIEAGIRWREKHGPAKVLPAWQTRLEDRQRVLALLAYDRDAYLAAAEAKEQAAAVEYAAFWERVDAKVLPQVAGRSENSDLFIQPTGKGGYRVRLTTGKILQGTDGQEYPETAFGYEAEVRSRFDYFRDGVQPVSVHWGSYSGMETPKDARTMMHVYEAAVELAMLVNGLLGLGEEGTDR